MARIAKLLLAVALVGGVVVAIRRFGPKMGQACGDWMEQAPDDFPPKRMFSNISAIREQNDRIIELLEKAPTSVE